jgi:anti-anti-sigma regulatory factor
MTQVTLAPVLDLTAADSLKAELLAAFAAGEAVVIDSRDVSRIGSPCLQVLAAAVRQGATLSNASATLTDAAAMLDLTRTLGLDAHV